MGIHAHEDLQVIDNLDIVNYQESLSYIYKDPHGTIHDIGAVVFDEAHFFCADSTFNANTSRILQTLIQYFWFCKRIYMTATPDDVKPIIAVEERRAFENYCDRYQMCVIPKQENGEKIQKLPANLQKFPVIDEYTFPASYENVQLHFF